MKTREELDTAWDEFHREALSSGGDIATCQALVEAERAFVDRAAQARAIRWIASRYAQLSPALGGQLRADADRIERGEVTIPEEP